MKTLEEEAQDFCERTDEEIGEYWSNDYEQLPIEIANFVRESKWVQAEKIKAKIEAVKEILKECEDDYVFSILRKYERELNDIENGNCKN